MSSTAHVIIEGPKGTIFPTTAVGRILTPMLPGERTERIALIVGDMDARLVDRMLAGQRGPVEVHDRLAEEHPFKAELLIPPNEWASNVMGRWLVPIDSRVIDTRTGEVV